MRYKLWLFQYSIRKFFRKYKVLLKGLTPCIHCNYHAEYCNGTYGHNFPICVNCLDSFNDRWS